MPTEPILPSADSYRPIFLSLSDKASRLEFDELMSKPRPPQCFDTIEAQLIDLAKARNPARKLNRAEAEGIAASMLGTCAKEEYGVWVFYPWANRLVHLLEEREFVELRTNRNKHKITAEEQELLSLKKVGVAGLSVGQSVAVTMAMERSFGEIRLADFDHLDLSNLNRIRAGLHQLGVSKALVAAREIAEMDPYLRVRCFLNGLTAPVYEEFFEDGGRLDLLIEECDSIDVKVDVRYEARRRRIPVLMDTSDRGLLDIERFDLNPTLPIFHGLIGEPDSSRMRGLTTEEKVPYVLAIIGSAMSPRMAASLMEVESSISTWPQLASSVTLGGALTADVARRLLLGYCQADGRFVVDLEASIPNNSTAEPSESVVAVAASELEISTMKSAAAAMERRWAATAVTPSIEEIEAIVRAGATAPSGGNCQPWRWLWTGSGLHLFHDLRRSQSLLDFESGGAQVALGAAWENSVLRAHELHWEVESKLFPCGQVSPLVVTMRFARDRLPHGESHAFDEMARYVDLRQTVRLLGPRHPIDAGALEQLAAVAASVPGAQIRWLTSDDDLAAVGELLGASDRIRFLNPELHRHLMSELRFNAQEADETGDGLAVDSLGLSPADRAGIHVMRSWENLKLLRQWNLGSNLKKMSRKYVAAASAVGLLTMPSSGEAFVLGGRAVERVWLTATRLALGLHPMTALPYLLARLRRGRGADLDEFTSRELRSLLQQYLDLLGLGDPCAEVMLFRLTPGLGPQPRANRRELKEILFT